MKIFEIYEGKLKITRENFDGNETASIDSEKSPVPYVIACAITKRDENLVPNSHFFPACFHHFGICASCRSRGANIAKSRLTNLETARSIRTMIARRFLSDTRRAFSRTAGVKGKERRLNQFGEWFRR